MIKRPNPVSACFAFRTMRIALFIALAFLLGCSNPRTGSTDKVAATSKKQVVENVKTSDLLRFHKMSNGLKDKIRSDKNLSFETYHKILSKDVSCLMEKYGATINKLVDSRQNAVMQAIREDPDFIYRESVLEQQNILLKLEQEKLKLFETFWLAGNDCETLSTSQKSKIKVSRDAAVANLHRLARLEILGSEDTVAQITQLADLVTVQLTALNDESFYCSYDEYIDKKLLSYCSLGESEKACQATSKDIENEIVPIDQQISDRLLSDFDSQICSGKARANLISSVGSMIKEIKAERLDYVKFNKSAEKEQHTLMVSMIQEFSKLIVVRQRAVAKLANPTESEDAYSSSGSSFKTNPFAFAQTVLSKEDQLCSLTDAVVENTMLNVGFASRGSMLYPKTELQRRKSNLEFYISWLSRLAIKNLRNSDSLSLSGTRDYEVEREVEGLKRLAERSTKRPSSINFAEWIRRKRISDRKFEAEFARKSGLVSESRKRRIFFEIVAAQDAGVDDLQAFKDVASRNGMTLKSVYDIGYEGASENWLGSGR